MPRIAKLSVLCCCWSECDMTSGTLAMAAIVCWQSEADCAESKSDQMCEMRLTNLKLSYPTWPSRWVLGISMQWLRLKGCHVACDEWTSGEICSLQHMWVTGSVMWAAASDESLKFGVQGATATNWFPRVNSARDNGIWLYNGVPFGYGEVGIRVCFQSLPRCGWMTTNVCFVNSDDILSLEEDPIANINIIH